MHLVDPAYGHVYLDKFCVVSYLVPGFLNLYQRTAAIRIHTKQKLKLNKAAKVHLKRTQPMDLYIFSNTERVSESEKGERGENKPFKSQFKHKNKINSEITPRNYRNYRYGARFLLLISTYSLFIFLFACCCCSAFRKCIPTHLKKPRMYDRLCV